MASSGIITLTTDFGETDPFAGVMKGAILRRFPDAKIVDLTHRILAHAPAEAGFWLERSFRHFTDGTVHVAVVDPGVGTTRAILALAVQGHTFLAPDNGLLGPVIDHDPTASIHAVDFALLPRLGLDPPSATFHGRDVFAPLAAELASGRLLPADLGQRVSPSVPSALEPPLERLGRIETTVVTIDHFGNLITPIRRRMLDRFHDPVVEIGGEEVAILRTYGDAAPGGYLALINAFDALEIARSRGSAAESLGAVRGDRVLVRER